MIQIVSIGLITVFLTLVLKKVQPEITFALILISAGILFAYVLVRYEAILSCIDLFQSYISLNPSYMGILMKVLGIAYISEWASNICKDFGIQSIASQIEMFGKITMIAISLPILTALLSTIKEFMDGL